MRMIGGLGGVALLVGTALISSPTEARGQEKLVVLNRGTSEAVLVDPESRDVLARLPTGPGPSEVVISPDGRTAFVANYGEGSAPAHGTAGSPANPEPAAGPAARAAGPASGVGTFRSTVTVLDLVSNTVRGTFYPGAYTRLHDIDVNDSGKRLFLTAEADSGVLELDARTGEVLMLWKTGGAMSHTLVAGPGGRRLYVANVGSDSVTVIDRLTAVSQRVPTGRRPEGIHISPDGAEVWVGNRGDGSITVIDARRLRPLETLSAVTGDPVRLRFTPRGRYVWVSDRERRRIVILHAASRTPVAVVPLDVRPRGIVFSTDGSRAFVTAPEAGRVLVVNASTGEVEASFEAGSDPDALGWSRVARGVGAGR